MVRSCAPFGYPDHHIIIIQRSIVYTTCSCVCMLGMAALFASICILIRSLSARCIIGEIDKITVFSEHPNGVVIIKFGTSFAAQDCISKMEGRYFGGSKIKAMFWDGITNYAAVKGSRKTNAPVDGNVDSTTQVCVWSIYVCVVLMGSCVWILPAY